jgi:hypothetical protein
MIARDTAAGAICGVTLAVLAGCATSSPQAAPAPPTGAHGAFVASVTEVCQRAVDAHRGHDFPVAGFDPLHPDPNQLPAVGDYFASYGGLPETDRAMHALRPSAPDTAAWAAVLTLVDQVTANARSQIRAARARDVATFVATVRTAQSLTDRLNAAAERLGLGPDSACAQVFG